MGSRKKNGSTKKQKKRNSSAKKKKNIVSSQNDLVTKFSQIRLNERRRGKGSNSDQVQLEKDFLKMDVAQLRDPAYPIGGLPYYFRVIIQDAVAVMEDLEEKPGDLSLRKELAFAKSRIYKITPVLKNAGYLPRDWDIYKLDLPSARFLVG